MRYIRAEMHPAHTMCNRYSYGFNRCTTGALKAHSNQSPEKASLMPIENVRSDDRGWAPVCALSQVASSFSKRV